MEKVRVSAGIERNRPDPGELAAVTSKDINKEARVITLNPPVKGHRPRVSKYRGANRSA